MSYVPPKRQDSLNEYFSRLTDFYTIAPNLLNASNAESFEIWLEKLELIDRRSLYFYLKAYRDELPMEHLRIAQRRFIEAI